MDKGVKVTMSDWERQTQERQGRDRSQCREHMECPEKDWIPRRRVSGFCGTRKDRQEVQRGCKGNWVACWIGPAKVRSSWDDVEAQNRRKCGANSGVLNAWGKQGAGVDYIASRWTIRNSRCPGNRTVEQRTGRGNRVVAKISSGKTILTIIAIIVLYSPIIAVILPKGVIDKSPLYRVIQWYQKSFKLKYLYIVLYSLASRGVNLKLTVLGKVFIILYNTIFSVLIFC